MILIRSAMFVEASPFERKLIRYTALLVALVVSAPKMLALRSQGLMAQFWAFELSEWLFQMAWMGAVCWLVAHVALRYYAKPSNSLHWQVLGMGGLGATGVLIGVAVSWVAQQYWFQNAIEARFALGMYGLGFAIALAAMLILVRMLVLLRDRRRQDAENQRLKNAQLQAEIASLQAQINPHFFFNALSSLSALVREDAGQAQTFIKKLSALFRYTLQARQAPLATLAEELAVLRTYMELMQMRFEGRLIYQENVDAAYHACKLPRMSLQLLAENAVKHNVASVQQPLCLSITAVAAVLEVANPYRPLAVPAMGTGMGLGNLSERCQLLLGEPIVVSKDNAYFKVRLPLLSA